jgi:hypothetical protein
MAKAGGSAVIFIDGSVKSRNWVVVSAELAALVEGDHDYTRVFSFKDGVWNHFDLEGVVVNSVFAVPSPGHGTYFLAREGRVIVLTPEGRKDEVIQDAGAERGKLGYVTRMRQIGQRLYVCGAAGQVYRREATSWVHIDQGIAEAAGSGSRSTLYGIDGTAEDDIYTVGQRGLVAHRNGQGWKKSNLPTNDFLMAVRCVSREEVYVCGRNGSFFRGHFGDWENLSVPKMKEHFWAVEVFLGKIYLAASNGLHLLDGKKVIPLDTGILPKPDAYRLQARDGVLWSFGNQHLCYFDGETWSYVPHPDNL